MGQGFPTVTGDKLQIKIFHLMYNRLSMEDAENNRSKCMEELVNKWLTDGGSDKQIVDIRFFSDQYHAVVFIFYESE